MPRKNRSEYNAYMRTYVLERYHARRDEAVRRLGGQCVVCGTRESLELDHIDPLDKSFPIGKLWSVAQKTYDLEVAKCQLLCSEHHKEKHRKGV